MIDRIATCPWCLYVTDAVTQINDEPGLGEVVDISLCIQCGMPAMMDNDAIGGLRKPTRREHEWLAANPLVIEAMAAWFEASGVPLPEDDEP